MQPAAAFARLLQAVKPMKTAFACTAMLAAVAAVAAEKPRVFITESQALNLTNDAAAGDAKSALSFTGGNSP